MRFRQLLPDGKERFGFAAADGQMGQIMNAYLDWRLSGDAAWLRELWPRIQRAIEFAWIARRLGRQRRGVLEGVQHNTYDVEFYGPNPLCGIYYLGALRAAEEMARAAGDTSRRGLSPAVRTAAAGGSTPTYSTAITTSRRSAAFRKTRSRLQLSATWARIIPKSPNIRSAMAACSIS